MRVALLALTVLVATGCMARGSSSAGGSSTQPVSTSLEIKLSIKGGEAPTKWWTLRCPNGGTLPHAASACRKLAKIKRPFAPVPKHVACTAIYGGPQVADVQGIFRGKPVNAHFSRTDGCQIARWDKVRFLFPSS